MSTKIFINLPVKNLNASKAFYEALGYSINPQFTNEDAACVVISEDIYVMILTHPFFQGFTKKEIADATKTCQVLNCLSSESREAVDEIVRKAEAAGGRTYAAPQDHGWMYQHGFEDLDGHIWEVAYMDITAAPATPEAATAEMV
jgi:hypothetical protein